MLPVQQVFRFGPFTLDVGERLLLRDGRPVSLRPKSFDTLLCLIERHGHLVRTEELLDRVWGETNVTEAVLTHCVAEARQALGDSARNPRFLKTVPRAGYKFVAEVARSHPGDGLGDTGQKVTPTTLAVLPFANLGGDPENEFFCDGLAEELINGLTRVPVLRVVAHSSSFAFKGRDVDIREIGRVLGVGAVVEGSVRRAGDRLRIAAQLCSTVDGCHIWAQQYDRRVEDVFEIQDEIAATVLSTLRSELTRHGPVPTPARRRTSPDTYGLYLKGRAFWHQRFGGGLQKAMESFRHVIEADPGFAPAHAGLASCHATLGIWGLAAPADTWPTAGALVARALSLDEAFADAHALRGLEACFYDWDWDAAARAFERALELNPGSVLVRLWNAHYLSIVGRFEEAYAEMQIAEALDPLSPVVTANLGWIHYLGGECDLARDALERVLSRDPGNAMAHFYLGFVHAAAGRPVDGIAALERGSTATGGLPFVAESIGWLRGLCGERDAAAAALRDAEARAETCYVPPSAIALIHVGLGNDAAALVELERAYVGRDALVPWLKYMPCFERLRPMARFQDILRGLGLE